MFRFLYLSLLSPFEIIKWERERQLENILEGLYLVTKNFQRLSFFFSSETIYKELFFLATKNNLVTFFLIVKIIFKNQDICMKFEINFQKAGPMGLLSGCHFKNILYCFYHYAKSNK